ncbi:type 11 methyltransferase [Salinisphaera sp. PC39]|uniref:class I SAM-dependent methyltransferase n=1 Tax=Salinisphaera sp. PC39 TaxID=1304156 RepID=UPI003340E2D1
MTQLQYTEVFDKRGQSYHRAMRRFPAARAEEFRQAIRRAGLVPGMRVADVPAGGGYLRGFLPRGCTWHGHEPSAGFSLHGDDTRSSAGATLVPLPWPSDDMDAAISIAGVHHTTDKPALFAELRRVTGPGGRFVLSDVDSGSPQAYFLDGFVDAHNGTGHRGLYLDETTERELADSGWQPISSELVRFHWVFGDRDELAAFCRDLFGLRDVAAGDIIEAIKNQLGIDDLDGGRVGMRWALRTITAA